MKFSPIVLFLTFFLASCGSRSLSSIEQIPNNTIITKSHKFITINPYKNAPLSAELYLSAPKEPLTITVKGQDGEISDISYTWTNTNKSQFPILGMYFEYTNTIIISTPSIAKTNFIVITNKPSEHIQSITVVTNNRPNTSDRQNFLDFFNPVSSLKDLFATDNFGKIRWYLSTEHELHAMKFTNLNHEVVFSILDTTKPRILTFNMLGKLVHTIQGPKKHSYNVPEADKRFHHDMYYRKNGNIIVLDKSQYGVEDTILEINPQGKIVEEISIGDWIRNTVNGDPKDNTGLEDFIFDSENNPFDEYKADIRYPGMPPKQNAIDWAHINALSFDEDRGIIYLSFRQHGIFAFDYNNKTLKWILIRDQYSMPTATYPFYNLPETIKFVHQIPQLQPYILKNIKGPDHPHAITFLSNNQFMVFDNSGNDGLSPEEGSRMLLFSVDETNMIGTIDWEYRHKDKENSYIYAQIVSDIDKTPFDTYIGTFGAQNPFTYIEVNTNKQIVFDLRLTLTAKGVGNSDIALPIACPTSRLLQNGVILYRGEYQSIYPTKYYTID